MVTDIMAEAETKMRKAIEVLEKDLMAIRTGHARPGLVESVRVNYYGVPTPLGQIASITAPEARLLVIQPWDRQAISAIERAILKSDLGLTPTNDGSVIRLVIPPLTEERRKEMVKLVRRRVEEGRVALRNVRREAIDELRDREKKKGISEDDYKRALEQLQRLTDTLIAEVDRIGEEKQAELLEV